MATFIAAYAVVWIAWVLYLGWMGSRLRRLRRAMDALEERHRGNSPAVTDRSKAA
jgi:threonine/homoserine/homoserine lactone efflux protein